MIRFAELGKVADVNWGDTSVTKASYVADGFPAYSATGSDGFLPYFDFDHDGIVLSAIGARCGKTWFASGKWSVIKNTIRFWSVSKDLDNKYLYWLTADPDFWPKRGAAQPFITIGDARKLKIPLPPLEEQKRIAAILDQADDIRRKRQHAIDRLNQLGQAIFHEMFGDLSAPETFKSRYRSTTLGSVVTVKGGGTPSKSNENFYMGDIPWVSPKDMKSWEIESAQDNITQDAIDKSSTTLLPENSVLIVNRSGILKHTLPVGIARRRVAINQDLKALICNEKVRPDFIAHLVKAAEPMVLTWVRATTADNFPIDNLKNMEIPVPSIEIQDKFVDVVGKIKLNFEVNRVSERKFSNLFASLQHRAFTGQL